MQFVIETEHEGQRLDVFLAAHIPDVSRTKLQKFIEKGEVTLNGALTKAKYCLEFGDVVTVIGNLKSAQPSLLEPIEMPLNIVFEDEDLIVIDKPRGLVVHPGAGATGPTLVQGLLAHCQSLMGLRSLSEEGMRPGIVHRLDKDTTGLMVCAKNEWTHTKLSEQFKAKTNRREYYALTLGVPERKTFSVQSYLGRHSTQRTKFISISEPPHSASGYRFAASDFEVDRIYGHRLCLMKARLQTGRTHQIRVHLSSISHPVVGDKLYGGKIKLPVSFSSDVRTLLEGQEHQLLHAYLLGFDHPRTGIYTEFQADFPEDFQRVLNVLEPYKI